MANRGALGRWDVAPGNYVLVAKAVEAGSGSAVQIVLAFDDAVFKAAYMAALENVQPKAAWPQAMAKGLEMHLTLAADGMLDTLGDIYDQVDDSLPKGNRLITFSLRADGSNTVIPSGTPGQPQALIAFGGSGGIDLRIKHV